MKGFCKKHPAQQIVLNNQCRQCVRDNIELKNKHKPTMDKKHRTIIAKWKRRTGA